jgi:hypothetical protein
MASPPYKFVAYDLETSIVAARKLWDNRADSAASAAELAVLLGYSSATNGSFLTRLANARAFGMLTGPSSANRVGPLARRILQPVYPEDVARARLEAFESIPLFKAFLDRYNGQTLPPENGLINTLHVNFGIDVERSKFVLTRLMDSAEQAGLFTVAGNRTKMVRPTLATPAASSESGNSLDDPAAAAEAAKRVESANDGAPPGPPSPRTNKIVDGTLDLLPVGSWTEAGLAQWLLFFEEALRVYYGLPKVSS